MQTQGRWRGRERDEEGGREGETEEGGGGGGREGGRGGEIKRDVILYHFSDNSILEVIPTWKACCAQSNKVKMLSR